MNAMALEALKTARKYIDGADECAFPDEDANEAALREVDRAIADLASAASLLDGVSVQTYRIGAGPASITVERMGQIKGPDLWAVRQFGNVLNKQGEWEFEPMPSNRDDEFMTRCRFVGHIAAIAAAKAAPAVS